MRTPAALLVFLPILTAMFPLVADGQSRPPRSRAVIMQETNIVEGKKLKGSPAEYKADKDPNTIEIVALTSDDQGANRVSEDGQVIFVRDQAHMKQRDIKALMDQAFAILEARERNGR